MRRRGTGRGGEKGVGGRIGQVYEVKLFIFLGKSYTVTGSASEPGLLPRALDVIFNSLDLQQQLSEVKVHPERFSELRYLNEDEVAKKQERKDGILNAVSRDSSLGPSSVKTLGAVVHDTHTLGAFIPTPPTLSLMQSCQYTTPTIFLPQF